MRPQAALGARARLRVPHGVKQIHHHHHHHHHLHHHQHDTCNLNGTASSYFSVYQVQAELAFPPGEVLLAILSYFHVDNYFRQRSKMKRGPNENEEYSCRLFQSSFPLRPDNTQHLKMPIYYGMLRAVQGLLELPPVPVKATNTPQPLPSQSRSNSQPSQPKRRTENRPTHIKAIITSQHPRPSPEQSRLAL